MFRYTFYCKYCGYHKSCVTKEDSKLEKKEHRRRGCQLEEAPHKGMKILARPQLAHEAREGKKIAEAESIEQEHKDEDKNPTSERLGELQESKGDTPECPGSI